MKYNSLIELSKRFGDPNFIVEVFDDVEHPDYPADTEEESAMKTNILQAIKDYVNKH